ncbi:MAG: hypothetical protein CMA60_00210 [Euryarchaeota archaeon]|nr:hypothetical protein [Euryarchaeota archaeon]|tara:strand:- start:6380 stop:6586 length:207 start_codon:yes stop_codon:yes gene_type:complete
MPSLFPTDVESAFETMALAFHEKNKWDARWFKVQVIGWSVLSGLVSATGLSIVEYMFDFNAFKWLFNL